MTRFIDDLDHSPAAPAPTPAEIDRIMDEARRMRNAAVASAFADIRHALARAVALRPQDRRATS
jgi:hypothetical protein